MQMNKQGLDCSSSADSLRYEMAVEPACDTRLRNVPKNVKKRKYPMLAPTLVMAVLALILVAVGYRRGGGEDVAGLITTVMFGR